MNEQVRHRIYGMEQTPPPGVWDRIVSELDQSDIGAAYAGKLKGMSFPPPPAAWDKIAAALFPAATPVIPRRSIAWVRYAAAAAVIAALVWGGSLVLNRDRGDQQEVVKTNPPPATQPVQTVPVTETPEKDEAIAQAEQDRRDDAALEASKRTYAKLSTPRKKKIQNAAGFHFALDVAEPVIGPGEMDPANRYIVLMTPDGNFIRMSKKWSELVCCVAGEEQDPECTDQLKKWKEKMASSSQTASPGNFGDILDLLKTLQND